MFCRYDQDLTPFFTKVQDTRRAQREARRRRRRQGWERFRAALGLRKSSTRSGSTTHTRTRLSHPG